MCVKIGYPPNKKIHATTKQTNKQTNKQSGPFWFLLTCIPKRNPIENQKQRMANLEPFPGVISSLPRSRSHHHQFSQRVTVSDSHNAQICGKSRNRKKKKKKKKKNFPPPPKAVTLKNRTSPAPPQKKAVTEKNPTSSPPPKAVTEK